MRKKGQFYSQIRRKRKRNMRNKSCGNGSNNCVAYRNVMRNGIVIGNPRKIPIISGEKPRLIHRMNASVVGGPWFAVLFCIKYIYIILHAFLWDIHGTSQTRIYSDINGTSQHHLKYIFFCSFEPKN